MTFFFTLLSSLFLITAIFDQSITALSTASDENGLQVTESGVIQPNIGDIALVLQLTVANKGLFNLNEIEAKMNRCCLKDTLQSPNFTCSGMRVFADRIPLLQTQEQAQLKLIFPTLYVYDRIGKCNVKLVYNTTFHIQHTVYFDTSLVEGKSALWDTLPDEWKTMIKDCQSPDQDRFRKCQPVDCASKYGGQRNHYNTTTLRCQIPTLCMSSPDGPLPDKAFLSKTNRCKDLTPKLTTDDVKYFTGHKKEAKYHDLDPGHAGQTVCVHGTEQAGGGGCRCDPGWSSLPHQDKQHSSTRVVFLCNEQDESFEELISAQDAFNIVTFLGVMCVVLFSVLVALLVYDHLQEQNDYIFRKSMSHDFEKMHRRMGPFVSPPPPRGSDFTFARVHTPNSALMSGQLELRIGDIITDLASTPDPDIWKGSCRAVSGTFPAKCVHFHTGSLSEFHKGDSD